MARRLLPLALALGLGTGQAADSPADLFRRGDYEAARRAAEEASSRDPHAAEILLRARLALGQYGEAGGGAPALVRRFPRDAALQVAAADALAATGQTNAAANHLASAARSQPGGFEPGRETPRNAAARALALHALGADPKLVLDRILTRAVKEAPAAREPALALATIALEKHDRQLAAETLQDAAPRFPGDADLAFLLSRSFDAGPVAAQHLEAALRANARHAPALRLRAERAIDLGELDAASRDLDAVLAVNPHDPLAWAQRAVIASLRGDPQGATSAREAALRANPMNADVDATIGAALCRRYRFAEGIERLEEAVRMNPDSVATRFELGANLLRFNREEEGWAHVEWVHQRDPYHVAAFNLLTLRDTMNTMETREAEGVRVRMSAADAAIYGPRAVTLAAEARRVLSAKYGVRLPFPITVDILPGQQDFAVRTFLLPGGEGFLGVCFGPLVTMASPRERLGRANWEAVVWHEIAHTITLTATRHRIPRWLSEGISVHEERAARPGWGMGMDSPRRAAILEGKLAPVAELDRLFREDIDLAYFQSSLVVDLIVERVGYEGLRQILERLARDQSVDAALAAVLGDAAKFQSDFDAFARRAAEGYGPGMDWRPLTADEFAALNKDPARFLKEGPARYEAVMHRARALARERKWEELRSLLEPLIALEPALRESPSPYLLLGEAHRGLGNPAGERAALEACLRLDGDALPAAERLLALSEETGADAELTAAVAAVLAVNPAHPAALLALGRSQLRGGDLSGGTRSFEAVLSLNPVERVRLRLELARALRDARVDEARRQVLLALADNPRFEPGLRLLRELPLAAQ